MNARERGCSQQTAAAKADISVRSGRRIEKGEHQPQKERRHDWRTRPDPLAGVWESELEPMLCRQPKLQPMTLFTHLQQQYPGKYGHSILRTLQRRVNQWRATQGPPQEVMFPQEHRPGEMGLSDFTQLKQVEITIAGKPFAHLLYHYRLAYSGWQYVQVVQGGESFVALSEGLQNALVKCGGVPQQHRSDSLSAAYRNLGKQAQEDLTCNYQRLCQHYQMQPTRNNRGKSHENGSIESPHGHFKRRLHQALLLRESLDFETVAVYQSYIESIVEQLNVACLDKLQQERPELQQLPTHRYLDYEVLSVKVTCHSTITVRCILYTVPSRLIGQRLTIHLYHDHWVGFVGNKQVVELPRMRVPSSSGRRRACCINYRHVIDSLRRKPGALLQCAWQQELLPDDHYRQLWQQLRVQFDPYQAARLMVEALYIAAVQDRQTAVAAYLDAQLQAGTLTLPEFQRYFHLCELSHSSRPCFEQHPLSPYDQLLPYARSRNQTQRDATVAAQIPQTLPHAIAVAVL